MLIEEEEESDEEVVFIHNVVYETAVIHWWHWYLWRTRCEKSEENDISRSRFTFDFDQTVEVAQVLSHRS